MAGTAVVIGYGLYRRELLRLFVTWLLLIGLTPKVSSNSAHTSNADRHRKVAFCGWSHGEGTFCKSLFCCNVAYVVNDDSH